MVINFATLAGDLHHMPFDHEIPCGTNEQGISFHPTKARPALNLHHRPQPPAPPFVPEARGCPCHHLDYNSHSLFWCGTCLQAVLSRTSQIGMHVLIYHDFINIGISKSSGSKPSFVCLACADDHFHSSAFFTSPARTGLCSMYLIAL